MNEAKRAAFILSCIGTSALLSSAYYALTDPPEPTTGEVLAQICPKLSTLESRSLTPLQRTALITFADACPPNVTPSPDQAARLDLALGAIILRPLQ